MARAALNWSRLDLATTAGIGVATVVRFESEQSVSTDSLAAMRLALEKAGIKFVEDGKFSGALYRRLRPAG